MELRTDLALEVKESFPEDNVEIPGVIVNEKRAKNSHIKVTTVEIENDEGAKLMGKPVGIYVTFEMQKDDFTDDERDKLIGLLCQNIRKLAGGIEGKEILIAGLGNRELTADALGPFVVDRLKATRHLVKEFGEDFQIHHKLQKVSAISPGVMAQTGMETAEILKGIIEETSPDFLIVIDALASRSVERLCTTIQMTNTGICPGSGVGNNRNALNEESLGIPVIAIGVPTVVDAKTIVANSIEGMLYKYGISENEAEVFLKDLLNPDMGGMFVTPKNIDELIENIGLTVAQALNKSFCAGQAL